MKRLVKIFIYGCCDLYFQMRFKNVLKSVDKHSVVNVIDIDNTLADTWPSLYEYVYRGEGHRYRSLSIFIGMRYYILDCLAKGEKVIFISARSFVHYADTCKWLLSNGLTFEQVVLVSHPDEKLFYIRKLIDRVGLVVYIDDLSYNQEKGTVKFYDQLIYLVRNLRLIYMGMKEIEIINAKSKFHD